MASILQVEFGEDPGLMEWTKGRFEKEEIVLIFEGDFIEASIVNTGLERAIILLNKEETCPPGGNGDG